MLGGHLRVGLEDNLYIRKKEFSSSSAQFVKKVKKMSTNFFNRKIASSEDTKNILFNS